jgi:hypothetical protein
LQSGEFTTISAGLQKKARGHFVVCVECFPYNPLPTQLARVRMSETNNVAIEILPVRSARERREFIELPYRLYRKHPHWVAPLRIAQKDILNTRTHPFYRTSDAEMFLARRDGRVVGRIMAILNHAHNEFQNERAGFFGFFEVEDDEAAARARKCFEVRSTLRRTMNVVCWSKDSIRIRW